jgi:[protein-PII] uridylyltransferase
VRPGNLTSWKLTLFDELYLVTSARLRRRDPGLQRFVPRPGEPASMPGRYYSLFHQDLRKHHADMMERMLESGRAAALEISNASGALRLTLVARDRPGLLAHTMAVFGDHGIEVMAADVFSSPGPPPLVLDVFRVVAKEGPERGIDVETIAAAEAALQRGLEEGEVEAAPARRVPPPLGARDQPTTIRFDEDAAGRRTIVEVETRAGPDVLRRITRALAAEHIEVLLARLDTEGPRTSNVFYVPDLDQTARDRLAARLRKYLS